METEKKENVPWYKRAWEHLTRRQQGSAVSFGVRGLLMTALMLCGIGWLANATSEPIWSLWFGDMFMGTMVLLDHLHWWSTWIAVGLTAIAGLRFGYRRWNYRPLGSHFAIRRVFVALQDGARRYRRFLLLNIALIMTYAILADQSWNRVRVWIWNEGIAVDWAAVYKFVMELMVGAVSVGMLWLGWKVIQHIRATFGRREPYEQAIRELRRELADEQRAHAQLRECALNVGQAMAEAIVLLRSTERKRGDARIGQARHIIQVWFNALVPGADQCDAMLERARRKVEGEDQPASTTTTPPAV